MYKGTALVVDDHPPHRLLLSQIIGHMGFRTRTAANGAEALVDLATHHVDLVVTDLIMPHLDGLRLSQAMSKRWPHVGVIMLTAVDSEDIRAKAAGFGVKAFLAKPLRQAELEATVEWVFCNNRPEPVKRRWTFSPADLSDAFAKASTVAPLVAFEART
jgi:two-component system capsular synthesis sensor histidine kinase RcsC